MRLTAATDAANTPRLANPAWNANTAAKLEPDAAEKLKIADARPFPDATSASLCIASIYSITRAVVQRRFNQRYFA
jgi:hypothetical protein